MATYTVTQPDRYFYLHEGGELTSLEELFAELQTMEPHVYDHHVSQENNDFSNWVRDVMEDRILAKNMALTKSKDDMLKLMFMNLFN